MVTRIRTGSVCSICARPAARGDTVTELTIHDDTPPSRLLICFVCLERMYLGAVKLRFADEGAH